MASELDIRGVFNFRDLASASTLLKPKVVYRSDGLHRTDQSGADAVAALGIRRGADLRSLDEQSREGMFEHPDVETLSTPLVADNTEIGRQINRGGDDPLRDHYVAMLTDSRNEIAFALGVVADSIESGRPVLFHCTAGKDRTGLLAALVLGLAGVDDEAIIDDFHASAEGVERMSRWYESERGEALTDKAKQMGIDPAVSHHMMLANRSTMEATLAALRSQHGSLESFAADIGVTPDQIASIASLRVSN